LLQLFSQFAASSVMIVWPNTGYRAMGQIRDPRPGGVAEDVVAPGVLQHRQLSVLGFTGTG
jgi:hypothetical protein